MKVGSFFATFLCSLAVVPLRAEEHHPLLDGETQKLLHETLSGELAKDHVIQITRHHRIQGSRGFRDAAQYVLGQLRSFGYSEEDAYFELRERKTWDREHPSLLVLIQWSNANRPHVLGASLEPQPVPWDGNLFPGAASCSLTPRGMPLK